jgi:phosphatidylglycerol---prolipoprotein diacylglyceryl transferase
MYSEFFQFNPDPVAFTLPFLDFQMRWYTLWTIIGISASYLVATFVIKDKLLFLEDFSGKNIKNWATLLSYFNQTDKNNSSPWPKKITSYFSTSEMSKINKWKGPNVSDNLKKTIIEKLKKISIDPAFYNEADLEGLNFSFTTKLSIRKFNKLKSNENVKSLNTQLLNDILPKKSIFTFLGLSNEVTKDLVNYIVIFNILGARLAHVLFYEWSYYQNNLMEILYVWKGGLASHGGVLGTLFGVFLFFKIQMKKKYPQFTLLGFFDLTSIYIGTSLGSIRLGNLFNQEILGKKTDLPWAIVFLKPENGAQVYPRHPVQLYESFSYYFCFVVMLLLWKKYYVKWKEGTFIGIGCIIFFILRFYCEFFKESLSEVINKSSGILMGQYLSLPFILMGIFLLFKLRASSPK